jgi:hypothetical protein
MPIQTESFAYYYPPADRRRGFHRHDRLARRLARGASGGTEGARRDDRVQQLRFPRADYGAAWTSRLSGDDRARAAFDHNSITPRVRGTSNVTWFAEDVELDFAKTASKGNLSGGDVLIAEEDYGVIIVGALDSERLVVYGSGKIGTADLGAERGALRSDLDRHWRFLFSRAALLSRKPAIARAGYSIHIRSRNRSRPRATRPAASRQVGSQLLG